VVSEVMEPPGITVPAWAGSVVMFNIHVRIARMKIGIKIKNIFLGFFPEMTSPAVFLIDFSSPERVYGFLII
jgi:hypothetical protein